jgi:hypothetical protein
MANIGVHGTARTMPPVTPGVRPTTMMKDQSDHTEEWRRLGYQEGMGSSSFLCPPAADFVRAYHMTSSEYAVSDIERCRLKVARFSEVNDPFELLGLNCHDPKMRKLTKRFRESQNNRTGLLSFSADWTNPVLWSHYAARHKGICLGFDLNRGTVQTVEYQDKRLRAALPDDKDPDTIPMAIQDRLCRTKSRDWQYEQELRVFVDLTKATTEDGLHFWLFDENMRLAEVILGPRCDRKLSTITTLVAATSPDAVVFKARLAFRSFRVVLDGRTRPETPRKAA